MKKVARTVSFESGLLFMNRLKFTVGVLSSFFCTVPLMGCITADAPAKPDPTPPPATTSTSSTAPAVSTVKALFDLPSLVGASESDLEAKLGKQTSRTESFAKYKPAGCEEVMVRITSGRATTFTVYFSEGATSPEDALRKVGINPTGPPDRTAPIAAIWSGSSVGVSAPEVSALNGAGGAGGWDGVQVK